MPLTSGLLEEKASSWVDEAHWAKTACASQRAAPFWIPVHVRKRPTLWFWSTSTPFPGAVQGWFQQSGNPVACSPVNRPSQTSRTRMKYHKIPLICPVEWFSYYFQETNQKWWWADLEHLSEDECPQCSEQTEEGEGLEEERPFLSSLVSSSLPMLRLLLLS